MTIRKAQLIAAAVAILFCSQLKAEERVEKVGDGWKMTIAPADNGSKPKGKDAVDPAEYRRIYRSIPFNRSEYNVNPTYRHDATMEILFGKMRDMTVVRQTQQVQPVVVNRQPVQPVQPYRYNGGLRRYGVGHYFLWNSRGLY